MQAVRKPSGTISIHVFIRHSNLPDIPLYIPPYTHFHLVHHFPLLTFPHIRVINNWCYSALPSNSSIYVINVWRDLQNKCHESCDSFLPFMCQCLYKKYCPLQRMAACFKKDFSYFVTCMKTCQQQITNKEYWHDIDSCQNVAIVSIWRSTKTQMTKCPGKKHTKV